MGSTTDHSFKVLVTCTLSPGVVISRRTVDVEPNANFSCRSKPSHLFGRHAFACGFISANGRKIEKFALAEVNQLGTVHVISRTAGNPVRVPAELPKTARCRAAIMGAMPARALPVTGLQTHRGLPDCPASARFHFLLTLRGTRGARCAPRCGPAGSSK